MSYFIFVPYIDLSERLTTATTTFSIIGCGSPNILTSSISDSGLDRDYT
jgi:hypothetical protein